MSKIFYVYNSDMICKIFLINDKPNKQILSIRSKIRTSKCIQTYDYYIN